MGKRYDYYPPGYRPEDDYRPPRQQKIGGCLMIGIVLFFLCGVGTQAFLSSRVNAASQAKETQTAEFTPEATADAWSATGTALYFGDFPPTATATATPTTSPTMEVSPTHTATPDAWQSTGTALAVLTVYPTWTFTPTRVPPTPAPPKPVIRNVEVTRVVQHNAPPPAAPEPVVIVHTQVVQAPPVVVTVQSRIVTATFTPTFTATATETPTASATASETATETAMPTATETATETATASATVSETATETATPTATETVTETPAGEGG